MRVGLLVLIVLSICGPHLAVAQELIWRPFFEMQSRGGDLREVGQGNLMLPLYQTDDELLFADLRGQWTDARSQEGNWGIAYRKIHPSDWITGIYGFYDLQHSQSNNYFSQATIGAELLNVDWGFRLNGYIPDTDAKLTGGGAAFAQGGNIVVRAGVERAYYGLDFEVERLIWDGDYTQDSWGCNTQDRCGCDSWCCDCDGCCGCCLPNIELWAAAGVYHFYNNAPGFPDMTGPRVRAELRIYDLPLLGNQSRLVLSGQYEHDSIRGASGTGMLTVRIPFGPGSRNAPRLTLLERRMVAPIVRDIDVVNNAALDPNTQPANFAHTGRAITRVVEVHGKMRKPAYRIKRAGANSVVVARGDAGVIRTHRPIDLNPGQVLVGGGTNLAVVGADTGARATFTVAGTRGKIFSSNHTTINAANDVRIQGLDLLVGGGRKHRYTEGIFLSRDKNVLIEDVNIRANGKGVMGIVSRGASQFTVNDSTISTRGDKAAGIVSGIKNQLAVTGTTINTSGKRSAGIRAHKHNNFSVTDSTINTYRRKSAGIASGNNNKFAVTGTTINTSGKRSAGIRAYKHNNFSVTDSTINTNGDKAAGIALDNNKFAGRRRTINTRGKKSTGIQTFKHTTFSVTDSTINTSGDAANGISAFDYGEFAVTGGTITTAGKRSSGVFAAGQTLLLDGVTIDSHGTGVALTSKSGNTNTTIRNSTVNNITGSGITLDAHGYSTNCLNAFGNVLSGGTNTIDLNNYRSNSRIDVTQASAAQLNSLNGSATVNQSGRNIHFNQPACRLPGHKLPVKKVIRN